MTESEIIGGFKRTTILMQGKGLDGLLPTKVVCDLVGTPLATLIDWVRRGVVTPTVRGSKARGSSHLFGYKTCLGMARAVAYRDVFGVLPLRLVKAAVEEDEATSDEDHAATLMNRKALADNPDIEERLANNIDQLPASPQYTPQEQKWADETLKRWKAIAAAYGIFGYGTEK